MYKIPLLVFLGFIFYSCDSDIDAGVFVVGSDYLSVNNKVILIDTLSVEVSTVKYDSLITSSQNRILIGNYDDPLLGKVKSDSYFQLAPLSYDLGTDASGTGNTNIVFDSISAILRYDKYFYGDTTKVQSFTIHKLLHNVSTTSEDGNFYNTSNLKYDLANLGSVNYKPRPTSKDSINIKLDKTFGQELFQKLKNYDVGNYDELTSYLKGFVLKSGTTNSASVIGFNSTSVIRLYYSIAGGTEEKSTTKDFMIVDASKQFNAISSDRTGTTIANLPEGKSKLSSLQSANISFIQSGTGIACRIDFPNIKQMKYIAEKGTIVDAELFIKTINNTYSSGLYPLPETLQVQVADDLNRISGSLYGYNSDVISANLYNNNDQFNENVGYTIKIGAFLQREIAKQSDARSSLIVTIPTKLKAVDRLVLGGQNNVDSKVQLKIYYITY